MDFGVTRTHAWGAIFLEALQPFSDSTAASILISSDNLQDAHRLSRLPKSISILLFRGVSTAAVFHSHEVLLSTDVSFVLYKSRDHG